MLCALDKEVFDKFQGFLVLTSYIQNVINGLYLQSEFCSHPYSCQIILHIFRFFTIVTMCFCWKTGSTRTLRLTDHRSQWIMTVWVQRLSGKSGKKLNHDYTTTALDASAILCTKKKRTVVLGRGKYVLTILQRKPEVTNVYISKSFTCFFFYTK